MMMKSTILGYEIHMICSQDFDVSEEFGRNISYIVPYRIFQPNGWWVAIV